MNSTPLFKKKEVVMTQAARDFAQTLTDKARKKLAFIWCKLETEGSLIAPYGERVNNELFAIRIMVEQNIRFFYFYVDSSNRICILNGYDT